MLRILSWIITVPLALLVLDFALSNRGDVTVSFWPSDLEISLPLSILLLGVWLIGLFMGQLMGWFSSFARRIETRRLKKALRALQEDTRVLPPSGKPTLPARFLSKINFQGVFKK